MNKEAGIVHELLNVLISLPHVLSGFSGFFPIQQVGFFQVPCAAFLILINITWALDDTARRFSQSMCTKRGEEWGHCTIRA